MPLLADSALPLGGLFATIPFWPLLGAIAVGVMIARRADVEKSHWPVVGGVALSAVLSIILFFVIGGRAPAGAHDGAADHATGSENRAAAPQAEALPAAFTGDGPHVPGATVTLYDWISFGYQISEGRDQWISLNFYFDGLTGVMMLFVTVVATLIVIYSIGYMRDHHGHPQRGYERFFAFLGLFVFSMAMLVMAGNFVLLYLGWEAVGLCSYLLIGFDYHRPAAAAAAKKAFIVNRIGDFGFAIGIFALYMFIRPLTPTESNPLDYETVFRFAEHLATSTFWGVSQATWVGLLLLCGAIGKSAQFPLHVWLPDAMEGPTPVSALIHAATMVTAGVYLVARCTPIFSASPVALDVVLIVGVIGAVLAATIALAQFDMKRILAYSTISQLAFMFVALGCGAAASGIFHVFTHAWFKALLFLGAGSVMHQMGNVIDVRRFSGLRAVLPHTYIVMLVGCLALAGFPLLSGFWSKDEIVHAAFERNPVVGLIMLATAGLTAFYTFRMFFLCFHGPLRLPEEAGEHPHESPPVMIRPLYVLAAGAVLTGLLGVTLSFGASSFLGFLAPHGFLHSYLANSTIGAVEHAEGGAWLMYVSAIVAIGGIALAWMIYGNAPAADPAQRALGPVFTLLQRKYYIDELYDAAFARPLRALGRLCWATDNNLVDGIVAGVAFVPRALGGAARVVHRGALQGYALSILIGLAALLLIWRWVDAA